MVECQTPKREVRGSLLLLPDSIFDVLLFHRMGFIKKILAHYHRIKSGYVNNTV